jgi:hypothetical protein
MSIIRRLAAAVASGLVVASLVRQQRQFSFGEVSEFWLHPGPWFEDYLTTWMIEHGVDDPLDATSGIAIGSESGDYIWATATPDWDRDWFKSRGWSFPRKWVPFHYLHSAEGDPGDSCRLRGL